MDDQAPDDQITRLENVHVDPGYHPQVKTACSLSAQRQIKTSLPIDVQLNQEAAEKRLGY